MTKIKPQTGFQENFAKSSADMLIAGGAAGLGKTFIQLLDVLYYVHLSNYRAIIFRRTYKEVFGLGGLKEESEDIYTDFGATYKGSPSHEWTFPSGAKVGFSHLQHEKDKITHKGSQYTGIYFDELTTFTETQFRYMFSRNRSKCAIRPYMRATTNPQSDGFVKDMIKWYLDDDGFPIKKRIGKVRYFMYIDDKPMTYRSISEAISDNKALFAKRDDDPKDIVKSFSFLTGSIYDNKKLLENDKSYIGNLLLGTSKDVSQLLHGCWGGIESSDRLISNSDIDFVFRNDTLEVGEKYVTADIAFQGSDKFVLCFWRGWRLEKIKTIAKSTGPEVVEAIKEFAKKYKVLMSNVSFDADGVGMAIKGFLPNAIEFKANKRALGDANYNNIKSQAGFHLARKIKDAGVYIGIENVELQKRIAKELRALRKDETSFDKIALIPKENKGNKKGMKSYLSNESPDYLDCFIMRASLDLQNSLTYRYFPNFTAANVVSNVQTTSNCYAIVKTLHYNFVNVIFVCIDYNNKSLCIYKNASYKHADYGIIAKDLESDIKRVKKVYVYRGENSNLYAGSVSLIQNSFRRTVGNDIKMSERKKILARNIVNELASGVHKVWKMQVSSECDEVISDFMSCLIDRNSNKIYSENIGNISDAFETLVLNIFR